MCSINGVYSLEDVLTKENIAQSRLTRQQLQYRGPDEQGEYLDERCCLESNRFSITGIHNGKMPILNEKGNIAVVLNGEIYNYRELKNELQQKCHKFSTESDTEVIVHGYEEYGEEIFGKLKGMYSLAIYDRKDPENSKLLLAKDRFGEKPLFYTMQDDKLYFASESYPLVELTDKKISTDALAEYFALGFEREHLIDGIKRLPPGKYIVAEKESTQVKTYWNPPFEPDYSISLEQAVEEYQRIFLGVIKQMLAHEVKSGILFSGGIDSATTTLALKQYYDFIDTISSGCVGMAGDINLKRQDSDFAEVEKEGNEFRFTRDFFRQIQGVGNKEKHFRIDDFIANFDTLISHLPGGPIINTSFPVWYFAAEEAKKLGMRVMFSGEGADEVLCGYKSNRPQLYAGHESHLVRRFSEIMGWLSGDDLSRLIKIPFDDPISRAQQYVDAEFKGEGKPKDILMNKLRFIIGYGLVMAPHMLERADGMTMAHPIEARLPFIHLDSAEFLYRLPSEYIVDAQNTKILLRQVARNLGVPEEMIIRSKQRTSLPYLKMFYESKYTYKFQQQLLDKNALVKEFLDGDEVDRLVTESRDNPRTILSLLILQGKLRQFLS